MRTPFRRGHRGFTLIELLTVIGIIVVLIAILLPVVARVRIQAQVAATQSQINQITAAIERYRGEQGAYPGPIANADFGANGKATVAGGPITMAENLVLGLCGGLEYGGNGTVTIGKVGSGASLHVANAARRTRLPAYIDPTPGSMMQDQPWGGPSTPEATDSGVPDFMDRFSEARPILYVRANVGNAGVSSPNNTTQYNEGFALPYKWRQPVVADKRPGDFDKDTVTGEPPETRFQSYAIYLKHPTLANQARNKDQYILVSAGADGIFGNSDDIFNGGN